jgi:PKD repeat protein
LLVVLFVASLTATSVSAVAHAKFTYDITQSDCSGTTNTFSAHFDSTGSRGDNYIWDFGDGSTPSNQKNPNHRYKNCGKYTVSLTVEDYDDDTEDTYNDTIDMSV